MPDLDPASTFCFARDTNRVVLDDFELLPFIQVVPRHDADCRTSPQQIYNWRMENSDRKSARDFLLLAFLTLVFCVSFTVSTFWMFLDHTEEAVSRMADAMSASLPTSERISYRSMLADERVASYVRNTFWISAFQSLGSLLAFVILIPTLVYTRRAALAAKAAADEAKIANEETKRAMDHSRDTSAVELRPYVTLCEAKLETTGTCCTMVLLFRNYGRSPALGFHVELTWGLTADLNSSDVPRNSNHSTVPCQLMPEQERRVTIVEESDPLLESVANETANLLIEAVYVYRSPYYGGEVQERQRMYVNAHLLERKAAAPMQ